MCGKLTAVCILTICVLSLSRWFKDQANHNFFGFIFSLSLDTLHERRAFHMPTQWTKRWCLPSSILIDSRSTTRSARSKCPSARSIWPKPSRSGENCRASRAKAVRYVIGFDSGSGSSTRLFLTFFSFLFCVPTGLYPRDYSEELAPPHTIPPTNSLEEH